MENHSPCSWDEFFFGIISQLTKRSRDSQTQCGCVFADSEHNIISTGFNSPSRNLWDEHVPTVRPEKYPYFFHAEENAIMNAKDTRFLKGAVAYVSHYPCIFNNGAPGCLQKMYHLGIRNFVIGDKKVHMTHKDNDYQKQLNDFMKLCKEDITMRIYKC